MSFCWAGPIPLMCFDTKHNTIFTPSSREQIALQMFALWTVTLTLLKNKWFRNIDLYTNPDPVCTVLVHKIWVSLVASPETYISPLTCNKLWPLNRTPSNLTSSLKWYDCGLWHFIASSWWVLLIYPLQSKRTDSQSLSWGWMGTWGLFVKHCQWLWPGQCH